MLRELNADLAHRYKRRIPLVYEARPKFFQYFMHGSAKLKEAASAAFSDPGFVDAELTAQRAQDTRRFARWFGKLTPSTCPDIPDVLGPADRALEAAERATHAAILEQRSVLQAEFARLSAVFLDVTVKAVKGDIRHQFSYHFELSQTRDALLAVQLDLDQNEAEMHWMESRLLAMWG